MILTVALCTIASLPYSAASVFDCKGSVKLSCPFEFLIVDESEASFSSRIVLLASSRSVELK